ncbi:hypothetical protein [Candidatus Amarobacter glycogenicus]|uniref:hypothetical protein n=1 Tax=Candidatus Amarobacter glycogenicus TaxID=3140699 RepID=UPI003135F66E|nr:hypothetical protein [Dehalococcoidia bacterium]
MGDEVAFLPTAWRTLREAVGRKRSSPVFTRSYPPKSVNTNEKPRLFRTERIIWFEKLEDKTGHP